MGFDVAKPKKTTTTTVEEADETPEAEQGKVELDEDVIRALVELDSANEIRWQIIRVSNPNSGYCFELSTAELSLDRIAKDAGPGKYQVRGIRQDGTYYKSRTVTVAVPLKSASTALTVQPPPAQDNTLLIAMMNANTAIVTAALAKPEAAFPWTALLPVAPLMLKELRDFFRKENQDDLAMERVLKLVTVAEKLRGKDANDKTSWSDIIRDGLSGVSQMVAARGQPNGQGTQPIAVRQPAPAHQALPSGTPADISEPVRSAAAVETPEAVEPTAEMLGQQWLQGKLEQLIAAAAANRNPQLQGELFVDELPVYIPETIVLQMLKADNWFEQLTSFDNRAQNYPAWFTELRESIIGTLDPDGDPTNAAEE